MIVVNGEIYNHLALRAQLGPDINWKGTSDTETLLQGYARWGHDVLDRLKGMFAFAIYDAGREELFFARDRLGIKPLYYTMDANGLRASSEVKVLVAAGSTGITGQSVSGYLQWGACPERNLLYSDLRVSACRPCHDDHSSGTDQNVDILAVAQGICFFDRKRRPASARSDRQGRG